ncbi:MAG: STAS domain-containing protein [Bacteroidetes bacterium]|nr:STAS domain-containing protein [Bacteroidota bacterium]
MDSTEQNVAVSRRKIAGEAPIVVNEIIENVLYSGFYGTLDSARVKKITDTLLAKSEVKDIDVVIIDLSNIDIIDSSIAGHLVRMTRIMGLIGVEIIYCGIQPVVAQSMISAGIEIAGIAFVKNLKIALQVAMAKKGFRMVKIEE